MKQLFLLLLLAISMAHTTQAQAQETLFSSLDLTGFWYTNSQHFAPFEEDTHYLRGGSIDFEFGNALYLGWSWHRMRNDALITGSDRSTESFRLRQHGLNLAYAPATQRLVHPRFGVYAGGGRLDISNYAQDNIFGVTPSLGAEINVTSWFRLGLEGGYRFITDVDSPGFDSADFSTPFAQIQLRFGFSWDDWSMD
jgi:hypothetical protein